MRSMLGNHIPLDKLASFSENLARCLAAGLSVPASLKSSGFALGPHFSSHLAAIRKQTEAGQELGLALKSLENQLPVFFIPTIQCGDETGRTPELLLYLAEHCRMMHRTWKTLRHTWLLPLATIVTFSCLRLAAPRATEDGDAMPHPQVAQSSPGARPHCGQGEEPEGQTPG